MKNKKSLAQKINVIRASVMGSNDGILSVAGIVIGVAGATTNTFSIFISGIAGMIAGTVSMAMGEYVSVNTESDSQKRAVMNEKYALKNNYDEEFNFVKNKYMQSGISEALSNKATKEMMNKDALVTTVREKYGFVVNNFTSPYDAAIASMISFPIGSILPLLAISLFPSGINIIATFIAVIIALAITGYIAAILSHANKLRSMIRNIISGTLTMIVTYLIGLLVGMFS
ncbi:VIT1/CCC1 transporter family protein [Apilactobacillus timberlakei]|uniref:VIT family protein n=1 Tax=Apilactobacillus timberlakei TaxID=2008380 RepID=A0ABY2YUG9_9LACO|nr:VIT family protein [Apilactobacillus timberlakei]TPR14732.1 VIT family protein [Apilactobacillus timberlakei]TPR15699.1 VIT family protein [Apilactobacillus timberlakei]TPR16060.1 VIT family protein [Apilactobacillus timberlakei]TPR18252.1 VIT family protein [Apilactobacillus timberlakei]TPR18801.1 VIT family protein [Apilactobacillus timberlakei]